MLVNALINYVVDGTRKAFKNAEQADTISCPDNSIDVICNYFYGTSVIHKRQAKEIFI